MRNTHVSKEHYINSDILSAQINRVSDAENAARKLEESKLKLEPANALNAEHSLLMKRIDFNSQPEDNTNEIISARRINDLMTEEEHLKVQEELLGYEYDSLISELSQDFKDKD